MIKVAVYLRAPQDANGNPRRGWALYNEEEKFLGFIDEGYIGQQKLKIALGVERSLETGRLPGVIELGGYEITAREYREYNKDSHRYNNGQPVKW